MELLDQNVQLLGIYLILSLDTILRKSFCH